MEVFLRGMSKVCDSGLVTWECCENFVLVWRDDWGGGYLPILRNIF